MWDVVTCLGSAGPWTNRIPPDVHGFYKWVIDALALLNEFVHKVVEGKASRTHDWANWIREDPSSSSFQVASPEFRPSLAVSGL